MQEDGLIKSWKYRNKILKFEHSNGNNQSLFIHYPLTSFFFALCYLLSTRSKISVGQKILLLNLSVTEILACFCSLVTKVFEDTYGYLSFQRKLSRTILRSFYVMYLFVMISITVDRFWEVYLNLKYPLYWSKRKMKVLMAIEWLI